MKFLLPILAVGILASASSCKKDGSSNISVVVNGTQTNFELEEASLLVSSNSNTIFITSNSNSSAFSRLTVSIQNNNSGTVDCVDSKAYDVNAAGWNGSTFIDNCVILLRNSSGDYLAGAYYSGSIQINKCNNLKVSGNFSAWVFNHAHTDSIFISSGQLEDVQLVKH